VWANRFLHTEVTRADKTLGEIFGWGKTPAQDAYKRYFGKFTQSTNQQVGRYFFSYFFQNLNILILPCKAKSPQVVLNFKFSNHSIKPFAQLKLSYSSGISMP